MSKREALYRYLEANRKTPYALLIEFYILNQSLFLPRDPDRSKIERENRASFLWCLKDTLSSQAVRLDMPLDMKIQLYWLNTLFHLKYVVMPIGQIANILYQELLRRCKGFVIGVFVLFEAIVLLLYCIVRYFLEFIILKLRISF